MWIVENDYIPHACAYASILSTQITATFIAQDRGVDSYIDKYVDF